MIGRVCFALLSKTQKGTNLSPNASAILAKVMGTQKSAISRDLKGRGLRTASMDRIAKMAEALGLRFVPFCVLESKAKQTLPIIQRLVAA